MFSNYFEIRDWLEGFIPLVYGKEELGLARIEYLLKLLGNPEKKFKSIHIAGTSGKGSTAFYIAQLLRNCKLETRNSKLETNSNFQNPNSQKVSDFGFRNSYFNRPKVGLHVSPHLVDIRERMQILDQVENDNSLMPMDRFIRLMGEMKVVVEKIQKTKPDLTPSYFEILVAASFKYFAEEKVDWAVVEVGLGGRLDATNVLMPEISVITNVGLDHIEILGDTTEKIAWEKAGIIKSATTEDTDLGHEYTEKEKAAKKHLRGEGKLLSGEHLGGERRKSGIPVVTAATGKALKVIEKVAKEKGSKVVKINTQKLVSELSLQPYSTGPLLAFSTFSELGFSFKKEDLKKVFSLKFPGRFEEIDDGIVIDGAHNPDKVRALIRWIKNRSTVYRLRTTAVDSRQWTVVLVLAFKQGKKWKKMIDLLMKHLPVKEVIATKFWASTDTGKFAAVEPGEIRDYVAKVRSVKCEVISNSQEAVFQALQLMYGKYSSSEARSYLKKFNSSNGKFSLRSNNNLVLVTGSLYLVGEVRTMWELPRF